MGGGAPPWRGVARLARLLTPRRVLVLAALTVLTLFYCRHYSGRSLLTRPRLHTSLTARDFCPAANLSSAGPQDLTYWGVRSGVGRVLVVAARPGPARTARQITDFLVSIRLKYKIVSSGRNLPDLMSLSKGTAKYLVVVFQDLRDYYSMDRWNRELLDKYCRQHRVGLLGLLPASHSVREGDMETIEDSSTNGSAPFLVTAEPAVEAVWSRDHAMLRILRSNTSLVERLEHQQWVTLHQLGEGVEPVLTAVLAGGAQTDIAVVDTGERDRIVKVVLAGDSVLQHWFMKLVFMDAMHYLTRGEISYPLTRAILVDIDDIFVGQARLVPSDVAALVESQTALQRFVQGFRYNLGFSGKYFLNGNQEEQEGDRELVRQRDKFWWFPHMWKHIQPHRFSNTSELAGRMRQNHEWAAWAGLQVDQRYAVAPHHSGVYPVHEPLYEAWRQVWDIAVTSTEEYPGLRPARRRRGFHHRGVSVLPRQTCGLFTKNLHYSDYPGGPAVLESSLAGGELFMTVVTNPVSVFMTHMPNYCCDRLAPYTFLSLASALRCRTNLVLRTLPPAQLAAAYFSLFPEEVEPVWGDPCQDRRHREIWAESKQCGRLPSVLVLGPQKTGTTALHSFLQLHPAVRANYPSKKTFEEVQFFSNTENYLQGVDWYMEHFPQGNASLTLFEKSATYFDGEAVPGRAARLLPDARLVVVLAPPPTRAYSWYQHQRAHNDVTATSHSFRQVLEAGPGSPRPLLALQARCLHPGRYALHLERWLGHYKPSSLTILDGEQLKNDPATVLNKLQHLFQLSPFVDYTNLLVFDKAKGFYCMLVQGRRKCLGRGKGRKYPAMDEWSRSWLRSHYSKHNVALEKLLTKLGSTAPSWLTEEMAEEDVSGTHV